MKRVILLLTFLVLISGVTAVTDFTYDAIQNNILKDQEAIFLLHITNNDYGDKTYGVHLKITSSTDRIEKYLPVTLVEPNQILDVELVTPEYIDYKKPTT